MVVMIFFSIIGLGILIYLIDRKIEFIKQRKTSERITARFIRYYTEEMKTGRNEFGTFEFPYVKIGEDKMSTPYKLSYRNQLLRPFKKGEEIDVFWSGKDLLYWNAYDIGLYKYLPEKWAFWKQEVR